MPKGQWGRDHHQWTGGIRTLRNVDEALEKPEENQIDMRRWLLRNMLFNYTTFCWEWQRFLDKKGYGQINLKGTVSGAHRLSYVLYNGLTNGLMVCHTCDNPKCVSPRHLFLGTHMDNMQDAVKKGRFKNRPIRYGEESPNYKHGGYCQ